MKSPKTQETAPLSIRCAIYTRKSTEEGLEQEFNSLDAQREAGEAYIASQKSVGWICLPDRYDDGGFTGGNMDRPALQRLMQNIEAGKVDCVVVYKVDRLSRSLMDFARMMSVFEKHHISFVSVTQQFNTTHSMGRLTLNILLSFAQFEREIISERTRDKIAAARKKGKWSGGTPILGYDIDPRRKLLVNESEGEQVRQIFNLYLQHEALLPVVKELARRGWTSKRWTTKAGRTRGGLPFTKNLLYQLLTNVLYMGRVRYKTELYSGEHAAIVDQVTFERVQAMLHRNGRTGGREVRNSFGALLRGLLYCRACGCAMTHTMTTKSATRRYRYYTCLKAMKQGWHTCPAKSIPAGEIEAFVVERIRALGRDPAVWAETFRQTRRQSDLEQGQLKAEETRLEREMKQYVTEMQRLVGQADGGQTISPRLADLQERIRQAEERAENVRERLAVLAQEVVTEHEVKTGLLKFDDVWQALTPHEQAKVVHLLIQRIEYDGGAGKVSITFHPAGLKALAGGEMNQTKEAVA